MNATPNAPSPLQVLAPDLAPALTPLLREERAQWNARFAAAKTQFPTLDGQQFLTHLAQNALPIVQAAHAHTPERTSEVWDAIFEFSLQLMGRGLLGNSARTEAINIAWRELLPFTAPLICQNPRRAIGRVSNALHTLSQQSLHPNASQNWCDAMRKIAPLCPDLETWERAGLVVAWRCGLAHARPMALQTLAELSPNVGCVALGIAEELSPADYIKTLQVLATDVWFDPRGNEVRNEASDEIQIVRQIGDFIGFGGAMSEPPFVLHSKDRFWIWNGARWLVLWADAFGATLTPALQAPPNTDTPPENWMVSPDGSVRNGEKTRRFEELDGVKSWAASERACVMTTHFSHRVFIVKC